MMISSSSSSFVSFLLHIIIMYTFMHYEAKYPIQIKSEIFIFEILEIV